MFPLAKIVNIIHINITFLIQILREEFTNHPTCLFPLHRHRGTDDNKWIQKQNTHIFIMYKINTSARTQLGFTLGSRST